MSISLRKIGRLGLVLLAAVFIGAVMWKRGLVFETVDDYNVMLGVSGDNSGAPYWQLTYYNSILAFLISRLYYITDAVQWYSVVQVFFLFISLAAIFVLVFERLRKENFPIIVAALFLFGLFAAFFVYPVQRIQFTTTAALLGTAGCAAVLSITKDEIGNKRKVMKKMGVSCLFMVLCFAERRFSGEGVVAFWLLGLLRYALLLKGDGSYKQIFKYCKGAFCAVLIFGLAYGVFYVGDQLVKKMGDNSSYMEYNNFRGQFQDHPHPSYKDATGMYEAAGWDEPLYETVSSLIYVDDRVNKESFELFTESEETKGVQKGPIDAMRLAWSLVKNNWAARGITLSLFGLVFFFIAAAVSFLRKKDKAREGKEALVLGVLDIIGFAFLIFFVCLTGRWMLRLYFVLLLPCAIDLLFLSMDICSCCSRSPFRAFSGKHVDAEKRAHRLFIAPYALVAAIACLLLFGAGSLSTLKQIHSVNRDDYISHVQIAAAEQYAIDHPDDFFVHDYSFTNSYNSYDPFRVYTERKPVNLMISGGSYTYTGNYYAQLAANGFTKFTAEELLADNVYYMTDIDYPQHKKRLREYMESLYDNVHVEKVADLGNHIHVYKFTLSSEDDLEDEELDNDEEYVE